MKLIVAGSRGISDYNLVKSYLDAIHAKYGIEVIIQGDCPNSPDVLAKRWADENNIAHIDVPADWDNLDVPNCRLKHNAKGKPYNANAGHQRNTKMATEFGATNLLAVSLNDSPGTANMVKTAREAGVKIKVVHL